MRIAAGVIASSLAGMALSGYLLGYKLSSASLFCLTGPGCSRVNASIYSELFGIPVALLGLGAYLALFVFGVVWYRRRGPMPEWLMLGAFGVALVGFLFSVWLTYVEAFILLEYCSWCLISFGLITINLGLIGYGYVRQHRA